MTDTTGNPAMPDELVATLEGERMRRISRTEFRINAGADCELVASWSEECGLRWWIEVGRWATHVPASVLRSSVAFMDRVAALAPDGPDQGGA